MTRRPFHVAIIGAGLGGLCLAQGLKQRGISFDVYEKDEAADSRTQGYRIKIDETGQQALATCLTSCESASPTDPIDAFKIKELECRSAWNPHADSHAERFKARFGGEWFNRKAWNDEERAARMARKGMHKVRGRWVPISKPPGR